MNENLSSLVRKLIDVNSIINSKVNIDSRVAPAHEATRNLRKMDYENLLDKTVFYILENSSFKLFFGVSNCPTSDQVTTINPLDIFRILSDKASVICDGKNHNYTYNQFMQVEQLGIQDILDQSYYAKLAAQQRLNLGGNLLTINRPFPPNNPNMIFNSKDELASLVRKEFRACNNNESLTVISILDTIRKSIIDLINSKHIDINRLENIVIYNLIDNKEATTLAKFLKKVDILSNKDIPSIFDEDYIQMLFL